MPKHRKSRRIVMVGCSRNRRRQRNKRTKRRRYRGGSGCGTNGCPIAPLSYKQMNQFGGQNRILGIGQNGGNTFYKPIGPMPGPFVGAPYSQHNLPANGNGNYYAPYDTIKDPQLQMKPADVDAGYNTLSSMVGGGLVPQDLLNLGNDFNYNVKSAYNALNGYKAPTNPLPYIQPLNKH